jgi:hypothetical protein
LLPESLEQANLLLDTVRMQRDEGIVAALRYLFGEWPELRSCTHGHIGWLIGMRRETISRSFWKAI